MPAQYRALWSTPGGGAGFTVLHFTTAVLGTAAQTIADQVQDFFDDLDPILPDDVSIAFDNEVLDLEEDGTLIEAHSVTIPPTVVGDSTGIYARAQGARIDWHTGQVVAGRRLNGRTYVVPIVGSGFDTTGLLTAPVLLQLATAAQNLIVAAAAARPLRVWSRTHATSAAVQSFSTPAKGAILRGRRD